MQQPTEKGKTARKWNPRSLYFKKDDMSIFCWLAMEKNIKNGKSARSTKKKVKG